MDFSGPTATHFDNVAKLNHGFLSRLRSTADGRPWRRQMPRQLGDLVASLTDLHIERLCEAPFLLLSVRENDESWWQPLWAADARQDLFDNKPADSVAGPFGAAVLSFLWQLAQHNPYAARLVSGASLAWCERLSDCMLLDLLQRVSVRDDWIQPRLAGNEPFWRKLLGPGLSSDQALRRSAHLTALQIVLTDDPAAGYPQLRAAACRTAVPARSVADPGQRS